MKIIPVSKYPLTLLEREHLKIISEVIKFKGDMSKESCKILQSFVIIGRWIWTCPTRDKCL